MINNAQIKLKIKDLIKHSGMTQTELARRLGVSSGTVSHFVIGDKMPTLSMLANICAITGADANDILCVNEFKKD